MIFDRNEQKAVVALLGAGSMGTAIVRRIAAGKKILLGDISEKALERVGEDFMRSGYDVETMVVNALQKDSVEAFAKKAAELGPVMYFIDTAGASPNQANPEHIVDLDMVGTGYAVDAFGHRRSGASDTAPAKYAAARPRPARYNASQRVWQRRRRRSSRASGSRPR